MVSTELGLIPFGGVSWLAINVTLSWWVLVAGTGMMPAQFNGTLYQRFTKNKLLILEIICIQTMMACGDAQKKGWTT